MSRLVRLFPLLMVLLMLKFPSAAQDTPEVISFTITPADVDRGGTITLAWEVRGVEQVAIEQYYGYRTPPDVRYDSLPAAGTLTVTLNYSQLTTFSFPQPYIDEATFFLLLPDVQASVWYSDAGVLASDTVNVRCADENFFFGLDPNYAFCPIAPAQNVDAFYQPFEHGFLFRRGDTGAVYALYSNPDDTDGSAYLFPLQSYLFWQDKNPVLSQGCYPAEGVLGRVRDGSQHALVESLGCATAPEMVYQSPVQDGLNGAFFHPVAYFTLPDGKWCALSPTYTVACGGMSSQ